MNNDLWFTAEILNKSNNEILPFSFASSKVVCVGRNYVEHAKELNNPVPKSPLLFIKPNSCLTSVEQGVLLPKTETACHHELEVAILIGRKANLISPEQATTVIAGVGLGLDLTLRDVQQALKAKGHPWERAKSFNGACPVTPFLPFDELIDLNDISFELYKNDQLVQKGNTADMIFNIRYLISTISETFMLYPGDIILTGTPSGVGELHHRDQLTFCLGENHWNADVLQS